MYMYRSWLKPLLQLLSFCFCLFVCFCSLLFSVCFVSRSPSSAPTFRCPYSPSTAPTSAPPSMSDGPKPLRTFIVILIFCIALWFRFLFDYIMFCGKSDRMKTDCVQFTGSSSCSVNLNLAYRI